MIISPYDFLETMNTATKDKKQKLTLILAESEIEQIPSKIQFHPQIKSYAKSKNKPASELLLDASYHHAAMKKLPDSSRRGRPDIAHRCALFALDSAINKKGLLQLYIHTRNEKIIWINPKTRLPRQYHRFIGLMEQLLKKSRIETANEVLLSIESKSLDELLSEQKGETFLLWEQGKKSSFVQMCRYSERSPLTVVIGGFPHGDFHLASNLIENKISIDSESHTASYLLAKTICTFEQVYFQQ